MKTTTTVQLHDKQFVSYLSEADIIGRVKQIALQINKDLEGEKPVFLAILNGAFMFAADLFKTVNLDCEICFIRLASYWGTKSTGNVVTLLGLDHDVSGRTVIILEDIIDTGRTLHEFLPKLKEREPKDIKIASLLVKSDALQFDLKIDYRGFNIPDKFVVGYGLDYDGLGRNLKEIYQLKTNP